MALLYPRVNGNVFDFTSIRVFIAYEAYVGIKAVSYKHTKKRKKAYGTRAEPVGRTRGIYEASGSIELLRSEADRLIETLSADGTGWMEKEFDIVVSMAEENQPTTTDVLRACSIDDEDHNYQGDEPNMVKLELDIWRIERNGRLPITDMR
jgi:hypothetical protein